MKINLDFRFPSDFQGKSDFIDQVENFCRQWYSDATVFHFKTSGSTGTPKDIAISRERMIASAEGTIRFLKLKTSYRNLVSLDTNRIAGAMMLVRSMVGKMHVIITPPVADPFQFLESTDSVDFSAFVPYQLDSILSKGSVGVENLNRLKVIICGGAPVSPYLEEKIRQNLSVPVFQTYGMTETVSHIAMRQINGLQHNDLYQGLPGIHLEQDSRGCLTAKGAVTGGESVVTNDLVEFTEGGLFRWLGRTDNIINSGGIKIQCEEIEATALRVLQHMNLNYNVLACGANDQVLGQKLVLFIEGKQEDKEHFANELRKRLDKYHYPRSILFVEKFPLTETGKINRQALISNL